VKYYLERTKNVSSTILRNREQGILKIGVIGYGRIAKRFIKEARFVSGVNIDSIYRKNKNIPISFTRDMGLVLVSSFNELLSRIDAVYIATPHHTHFNLAKKALLNGKHVLCEKPITLTENELKELIFLAKKNNLVLMEALKTAYMPAFIKLINIAKSGIIGDILDITSNFTKIISEKENRREFNEIDGGSFNELASYIL